MTIQESINILNERIEFAGRNYSGVAEDYKLALLTAVECMKKLQAQVYCRDCKNWGVGIACETDHVKCCKYARYMVGNNGYCCYAERRSDD